MFEEEMHMDNAKKRVKLDQPSDPVIDTMNISWKNIATFRH